MKARHALALSLLLAGCAGIGKQDFACPGQPSRPLCLSTSEVYRLTEGPTTPQSLLAESPVNRVSRHANDPFLETSR
jgi:hypothetical protein